MKVSTVLILFSDPRTSQAYGDAQDRNFADPQLGLPDASGPAATALLQTLREGEEAIWISYAYELRPGPVFWWVVVLTRDRLIGVAPSAAAQVWATPVGSWTATTVDGDVVLDLAGGMRLRVRGGGATSSFDVAQPASDAPAGLTDQAAPAVAPAAGEGAVVSSWQEAEALARWHMGKLGFDDAGLTAAGADGGIDVVASNAAAQVKHYAKTPIGSPPVQQLRGAAVGKDWALFYAWSGFTRSAVEFAESSGVALFRYDEQGVVEPVSSAAEHLMKQAGLEKAPDIDGFELEREAKQMAQQYFDLCWDLFSAVMSKALTQSAPGSRLRNAAEVELERVKAVVLDIGARSLPLTEFLAQVERINEARDRLSDDLDRG